MSGLFGGRSSATATNTSSQQYDNRSVVDAGGGIAGSGNNWDQSSAYSYAQFTADNSQRFTDNSDRSQRTSFTDSSDRSQRTSFTDNSDRSQRTSFTDSSDRSQRTSFTDSSDRRVDASQSFADWSNRSTTTKTSNDNRVSISTDGGAFDLVRHVADGITTIGRDQIGYARDLASRADTMGKSATDFAIRSQEAAVGFADQAAGRAFDLARSSAAQAFASSGDALGFTRDTFASVIDLASKAVDQAGRQAGEAASTAGAAYSAATNTASGNKTLIYMAIGAVALVGAVAAFKSRGG